MKRCKLILGYSVFIIIILSVIVGPFIYKVNPNTVNMMKIENPPNIEALLGTDSMGRDVLARLMEGGKISLTVGILATLAKLAVALILGFISAFFDRADSVIMRMCDVLMCFPFYVLAISMAAFIGPSVINLIIIIVFFTFLKYISIFINLGFFIK